MNLFQSRSKQQLALDANTLALVMNLLHDASCASWSGDCIGCSLEAAQSSNWHAAPTGLLLLGSCYTMYSDGMPSVRDRIQSHRCSTLRQGHFCLCLRLMLSMRITKHNSRSKNHLHCLACHRHACDCLPLTVHMLLWSCQSGKKIKVCVVRRFDHAVRRFNHAVRHG